ncbi:MAG: hypothetical protein EP312_10560 [Gammaproteobacteria bacterium]|nr:MAG: hypothetical protein EP312_10560 [Gammaproteobacteria bacterium]
MRNTLIALFALACVAITGCSQLFYQYEDPKVDLVGLELLPSQSINPGFRLTLQLTNPNDRPLPISGLYYEVSIEGHDIAAGSFNEPLDLPAYGRQTITSDVRTSLLGSINLISDLAHKPRNQINYALSAKISVGGWSLPIRIQRSGTVQFGR